MGTLFLELWVGQLFAILYQYMYYVCSILVCAVKMHFVYGHMLLLRMFIFSLMFVFY